MESPNSIPHNHPTNPSYTKFPPPPGNTRRRIPIHLGELAITLVSLLFLVEVFLVEVFLVLGRRLAKPLLGRETRSVLGFSAHGVNGLSRVEVVWVLVVLIGKGVVGPVLRRVGLEGWMTGGVGIMGAGERRERGLMGGDESSGEGGAKAEERNVQGGAGLRITGPSLEVTVPMHITKADIDGFVACLMPGTSAATVEQSQPLLALFLSAVSSPAQLLLLAKRQCPIKPLGAVNVRNRFELLKPGRCRDLWTGNCRKATARAKLGDEVRARKRGLEVDLIVEVSVEQDEKGREEEVVFRQVFTVLQFQKHSYPVETPQENETNIEGGAKTLPFSVGKKNPGLWAALCKDYNPIHISGIAAKVLGLPGRIAHGNCVVAKAWALHEGEEQSSEAGESADEPMYMEVGFKRPITVPSKVDARLQRDAGKCAFQVTRNDKVRVVQEPAEMVIDAMQWVREIVSWLLSEASLAAFDVQAPINEHDMQDIESIRSNVYNQRRVFGERIYTAVLDLELAAFGRPENPFSLYAAPRHPYATSLHSSETATMLEARLEQAQLLKKVVEAIRDLVQDCNFDCNDSGIALQAMDNSHVALVSMLLNANAFSPFRCDRNIALGINLTSLTKVLRAANDKDILTLKAEDAPDVVNLVFESTESDRLSEYDIKLMDIDQEHLGIPETQYAATITMPCNEFQRICKDLMALSESVAIECTKEGVKFSCNGDIGSGSVTLRSHTDVETPAKNIEINLSEPVSLTFSLKYLVNFCKASGLSSSVKLCLSNEVPLLVEYPLAESGSYLRFYLAPKIGDEE